MQKSILTACCSIILLASCTTSRDNKAVSRVISKPALTEKVGRVWEKSNPCTIDTVITFKDGVATVTYDTLPVNTIVYDTTLLNSPPITEYRTILKTVSKTDTIKVVQTDTRRLGLALQDNAVLQGKYDRLTQSYNEEKKTSGKKTWWIVGLIALILGGTFLKIKNII